MLRTRRTVAAAAFVAAAGLIAPLALAAPSPPPDTRPFCADVPDAYGGFVDTRGTANEDVIECLAYTGITAGRAPATYDPTGTVTRAQMATFVVRMLDLVVELHAGSAPVQALPDEGPDAFADDDGLRPHEASIDRLAAAGVVAGYPDGTFRPSAPVNRAQMATFLNNAQEFAYGARLATAENVFVDDDGLRPHEPNIDGIAAAGVAQGIGGGRYDPIGSVSRNQMAAFIVRYLSLLHAAGTIGAARPPGSPPPGSSTTTTTTAGVPPPPASLTAIPVDHDTIRVELSEVAGAQTYRVHRLRTTASPCPAPSVANGYAEAGTVLGGTADADSGTTNAFVDDGRDSLTRYCYYATAFADGRESGPSNTDDATTTGGADGAEPGLLDAELVVDAGAQGRIGAGDVIELCFGEAMADAADAGAESLTLRDGGLPADQLTLTAGNASFVGSSQPSTNVAAPGSASCPADQVLVVTVTSEPTVSGAQVTPGVQVPARITGASGIDDANGNAYEPDALAGDPEAVDVEPGPEPD